MNYKTKTKETCLLLVNLKIIKQEIGNIFIIKITFLTKNIIKINIS